tara:strand:+ start:258 stop:1304 length:1047 start_codon:yes stop_codon:yes gene_type:complete
MIENFLLMTIVANYGLSSIPWWCYLIGLLFLFGFVKKRLNQTIHKHALNGKLKAIKKLANSKGIDCLETRDLEGCSPLHYAALSGHKEIVEFLLNKNVNINPLDKGGISPLFGAVLGGHIEIINILLKNGADKSFINDEGESLLDFALKHTFQKNLFLLNGYEGMVKCVDYLRSLDIKTNANNSILLAAKTGNFESIKEHLASGIDINEKVNEQTPLSWSVTRGDTQISKYLIFHGANIGDMCADGSTLLDVAIQNDDKEIIEILSGQNAKKTCGRCCKIFSYKDVRKLWCAPLFVLKLFRMHPGDEGHRLYCIRCSRRQNIGIVFLATMFGSLGLIFIIGLVKGIVK